MTGTAFGGASSGKGAASSTDGGNRAASGSGKRTIGSVASDAIREGLTNEQALERVLAVFPYARTTKSTIGKYRRMLWSRGEEVPTAAQARAEAERRQLSSPCSPGEPGDRRRTASFHPRKQKTVGSVAMDAIREGRTTKQVVAIVKAQFPGSRISESAVNSYRSRLRRRGEAVPTALEATDAGRAGIDLLVSGLEEAGAAPAVIATKADLSALETRLIRCIAALIVAASVAVVAAVALLS